MVTYRAPDLAPPTPLVDQWLINLSAELSTTLPLIIGGLLALGVATWFNARRRPSGKSVDA